MLITLSEFVVDGGRVLETVEDFKGEDGICEVLSITWLILLLLETLRLFLTDELQLAELETEVGVWLKAGRFDVAVIPATGKAGGVDVVDLGTRNA